MNYYTDSKNGYSMNNKCNRHNDEYYYDDSCFARNNDSNYYDNEYDKNGRNRHSCCVRRIEETLCCHPSYYNEEKKEDKKEKCFEGTFKICPKEEHKDCNEKNDYYEEKDNKQTDHKCGCRCHNRCGFCGLFGRW